MFGSMNQLSGRGHSGRFLGVWLRKGCFVAPSMGTSMVEALRKAPRPEQLLLADPSGGRLAVLGTRDPWKLGQEKSSSPSPGSEPLPADPSLETDYFRL